LKLALLAAALIVPALAQGAARFAVVVGNDAGATGRPRLWFAEKDADRFKGTLRELGDFSEDRTLLLQGATPRQVREALAATEARIQLARVAGERTLLVFYYSGHAGSAGLELGSEVLSYADLRTLVGASKADAKVAIVDACESGLLTQVKGATAAPALDFAVPLDDSVRGTAFIASTAVGESAQESAVIGGSFFTHHLEVGLRGAADIDGDGLVTLGEAFRYTSAQTVSGTAGTMAGTQHPTYEFKMSGRGDVVLADLRKAEAKLVLPADPGATYILRGPKGLLAEVSQGAAATTLALPAGRYVVERRGHDGRATADLVLESGATKNLPPLTPTRYEVARSKGGPKPGLLYAGAGIDWVGLPNFGVAPVVRLGLRKELGPVGLRFRFDYSWTSVVDQGLRYDWSYLAGGVAALFPLNTGAILIEAGPEVGYGYARQTLGDQRNFSSGVLWAGVVAMVTAPVGPVRIGIDASFGAQAFRLNESNTVKLGASALLLVLWGF
jgi:hypothetical protein